MKASIGSIIIHPLWGSLGTSASLRGYANALQEYGIATHIFSPYEKGLVISDKIQVHNLRSVISLPGIYRVLRSFYSNPIIASWLFFNRRAIERTATQIAQSTLATIERDRIHLDIIQGEQEIPALAASIIGQRLRIPSVAHFHNVWAEEAADIGLLKRNNREFDELANVTRQILTQADLIITPTQYMKDYFQQKCGVLSDRVIHIARGSPPIQKRNGYPLPYRVVYSGTLSKHENVKLYIQSAAISSKKRPRVEFYISGKGESCAELKSFAAKLNARIEFMWFSSLQEYLGFLSAAHIGIVPWKDCQSRKLGYPMKLLDYACSGMATIATNIGGWTETVEKEKIGLLAKCEPDDIALKIVEMLDNPQIMQEFGKNGQAFAQKQTWKNVTKDLVSHYTKLIL